MRIETLLTASALACAIVCGLPALAQDRGAGIEWQTLNNEVLELIRTGQYDRGVVVAREALAVAKHSAGADHPDTASSLNNLAWLYAKQARYAEAEPLHKRALAISEKALGVDHPFVGKILENLSALYRETGRESQAAELEERAAAIRAKQQ